MADASVFRKVDLAHGDLTRCAVDAIVNAANESLLGGGGVDGAIHRAAGPALLEACRPLRSCEPGEAKITPGFDLPARFVIHTVGPRWRGGDAGEDETLRSCYQSSLHVAAENGCRTVAFPAISTGAFGFPPDRAARIALETVGECLAQADCKIDRITLLFFSEEDLQIAQTALEGILSPR